jgi:adenylate cyclase
MGIAGAVFNSGEPEIIKNAYDDPRFNQRIDDQTGYHTKSIMALPFRTIRGKLVGVVQCLNKLEGDFDARDIEIANQLIESASTILDGALSLEQARAARDLERHFLEIVSDMTSDLDLSSLLKKVMGEAQDMLAAERSTLFLNDEKRNELWSQVGEGLGANVIRFPNHLGIAGAVFTSGKSINIPHAYADLRFNPGFDRQTGFFTRSILCVPVLNKTGRIIGVTQVLNKRGGPFTQEDEQRLRAFTAQIAIGLENAKLFADVTNMRNYNQSILESMSNGVITIDDEGLIATCNIAGARIMRIDKPEDILKHKFEEFFGGPNAWLSERIKRVEKPEDQEVAMDATLEFAGESISANVSVSPLIGEEEKKLGAMVMIEDISGEKRMRATMSRYMDPGLADQLLSGGQDALGGQSVEATIVFTDVRSFTTLTEALGAQGTVALLNEYFTLMVDCITKEVGCSISLLVMPSWRHSAYRLGTAMTKTEPFVRPFKC